MAAASAAVAFDGIAEVEEEGDIAGCLSGSKSGSVADDDDDDAGWWGDVRRSYWLLYKQIKSEAPIEQLGPSLLLLL